MKASTLLALALAMGLCGCSYRHRPARPERPAPTTCPAAPVSPAPRPEKAGLPLGALRSRTMRVSVVALAKGASCAGLARREGVVDVSAAIGSKTDVQEVVEIPGVDQSNQPFLVQPS